MRALIACTAAVNLILVGCRDDTDVASDLTDSGVAGNTGTGDSDSSGDAEGGDQEQATDTTGSGDPRGVVTVGDVTWEFVPRQYDILGNGVVVTIWHDGSTDPNVPDIASDCGR